MRRHRRVNTATTWAAAGAALLVHGALLGSVSAFGLSLAGDGMGASFEGTTKAKQKELVAAPELKPTCSGDVILATGARYAMCLAPWNGDVEGCGADAMMSMWIDLSACSAGESIAAAPINLISPKQAEKLASIDPERLIDEAMQQELAKQQPPPPPPPQLQPQQQAPPPPPPPQRPAQVVETAKPNTEKEPVNARFLSENNVEVEKQKVARGSVQEPMVAKSKAAELTPKPDPKEASVKELSEKEKGRNEKAPEVPGLLAMRPPGARQPSEAPQEAKTKGALASEKGPLVADGFVPRHGDGMIEQAKRDPGELAPGRNGAGGGAPQVPNLKPSPQTLERIAGGGSVDHLDDVENGDETALSSKRWIYASFFNRLKRQVAQNWDPANVWRRVDPQGTVYGFKTRVTEVRVSLSGNGTLSKIVVTAPSGVQELDDEAVKAFHASAPFPNPPDGLVQKDGLITFAFSFYFEIGAPRSSWRVIRSM